MARSAVFGNVIRAARIAAYCQRHGISTEEALERLAIARSRRKEMTRSEFLATGTKAAALGAIGSVLPFGRLALARRPPVVDVAIVGGGIAGLTCADTLAAAGVPAIIYDGRGRLGGRIWTEGALFPGQVVERGGEFIDNLHLTMKAYAKEFGLTLEDMQKEWLPGDTTFYFLGRHVSEAEVVDEFRDLVDAMRRDLARLSNEVTATSFTEFDQHIDHTSLADYLAARGAGPIITEAVDVAYTTEYGCEIDQQSTLNFIFFIHIDKRSKWTPFGVFSDERYHVIDGNQQIPARIADRLPGPIELEAVLVAARKLADGRIQLTFDTGASTLTVAHEAVVLAIPFSTLRLVDLDPSLGLPPEKTNAIENFQYGTNAKINIGFNGRYWGVHRSNGESYSDLPNHQLVWEVNPSRASDQHAVLIDYSGGERGARLNPANLDGEVSVFLTDLDTVLPGALGAATRVGPGRFLADLHHWPSDPLMLGSYTCNQPGYFTTILGHEATPVGNVFFAGEHTDIFYEWQGFMEGAANSGIRAANEVLAAFR